MGRGEVVMMKGELRNRGLEMEQTGEEIETFRATDTRTKYCWFYTYHSNSFQDFFMEKLFTLLQNLCVLLNVRSTQIFAIKLGLSVCE